MQGAHARMNSPLNGYEGHVRMHIEVHSKEGCPWCEKAKEWLFERGHPYVEVRHDDPAERAAFYDKQGLEGGARTMPQVFIVEDGESMRVGGYDKLDTSGL